MARPTEEAEAKFRDAEAALKAELLSFSPRADDAVGKAVGSLLFGEIKLAQGLQKLAVAIRQVFDKN